MSRRTKVGRYLAAAFGMAVIGAAWLAAIARPSGTCVSNAPDGASMTCTYSTILSDHPWPALVFLSIPVAVALVPVVVRRRSARTAAAILLWAACVLGGTSFVGIFFMPAAILMTVAAARHDEPVSMVS